MTTPITLPGLIEHMIARAHDHDPAASYTILTGWNPIIGADWIAGKEVYQFFPVGQSRLIPDDLVVLVPVPDNARLGALREFHAELNTGRITERVEPTKDETKSRPAPGRTVLRPMAENRLPAWIQRSQDEYARDLITAGKSPENAAAQAADGMTKLFPNGEPADGHLVFDVTCDDQVVGYLWIGPDLAGTQASWWVWDIVINPEHRGHGLGRETMLLAETYARAHGGHSIGLNVFGHNTRARRLYETLGYDTTNIRMRKQLDS